MGHAWARLSCVRWFEFKGPSVLEISAELCGADRGLGGGSTWAAAHPAQQMSGLDAALPFLSVPHILIRKQHAMQVF
jgi:hypothetical protein